MFSLQDEHGDDVGDYGDNYDYVGDDWNNICTPPAHILNILTLQGIFDEQLVELLDLVPSRKGPAKSLLELNFDNQKYK